MKNYMRNVPTVGLDVFWEVIDLKQISQTTSGWADSECVTGILSGPQTEKTSTKIQKFFNQFGAGRGAPVDWSHFEAVWDSSAQLISSSLEDFALWGDRLDDSIVRSPLVISAGEGLHFLFDTLADVAGFGPTRAGKLLARAFPDGFVAWDHFYFRSLWKIPGNGEAFVQLQQHAQVQLQELLLEIGRRGGLSLPDSITDMERRALRPGSSAQFKHTRRLPKLMDEFFQGLPLYLQSHSD